MTALVRLVGVTKRFGAAQALAGVDLDLHPGEVVAVVGDNGAGKSTLAGVLTGVHPPDAGHVAVDGEPVTLASPAAARGLGITGVQQELALAENLDVVENIFLAQEPRIGPFLDEVAMERQAWELLDRLGARVPGVRLPVHALSGGQRRAVAVARALLGGPRVVVLDEPTAALGVRQTAQVLQLVGRLRADGRAVVLISHSITDVQAVADRIVVLRLGHVVGEYDATTATSEDLLAAITGAGPVGGTTGRTR